MKKAVVFIYSLGGGGAEKVALELASGLRESYEVTVVTLSPVQKYDNLGFDVVSLHRDDLENSALQKFLSIFRLAARFASYCRQNRVDAGISILSRPNIIAAFAKLLYPKMRLIASEHTTLSNYYGNSFFERVLKKMLNLSYKIADSVVAVSYGIRSDLSENFGVSEKKIEVIYNPTDIEKIKMLSLQKVARAGGDGFVFVSAGRLVESKNYPFLFEAFRTLPSFCKLWILGSGEMERELKFLAVEMGMHERVSFFGFCENPYSYFASADCFVMASRLEGLPTVLIEALACGLPIVSTDCKSGPREILVGDKEMLISGLERAEYGVLVSLDTPRFLSLAMQKIIEEDALRAEYAAKAKERAQFFSKEKSIMSYKNLVDSL